MSELPPAVCVYAWWAGFTEHRGSDSVALLLSVYDAGRLQYIGHAVVRADEPARCGTNAPAARPTRGRLRVLPSAPRRPRAGFVVGVRDEAIVSGTRPAFRWSSLR